MKWETMDELKKRTWRIFVSQHGLDGYPMEMVNLAWKAWNKAFDKGIEYKDEYNAYTPVRLSDDGNVRIVPKSDGAMAGRFLSGNEGSQSVMPDKKIKDGDDLSELAFCMAVVALVLSIAAIALVVIQA